MEKVSIIVPIYNMAPFVEQGLSCLCSQTYQNIEILVVDDGSTDGGFDRVQQFARQDGRIRLFRQENAGPGPARNLGIAHASGTYAYFFDIDDTLVPDAIETLVQAMEQQQVDLVVCGFELYNGQAVTKTVAKADRLRLTGEQVRCDYYRHMFMYEAYGIQAGACFKLYRMAIIRAHQLAFCALRRSEDDLFVAGYVSHIGSVFFLSDILCRFYSNNAKRFWAKYTVDTFDGARAVSLRLLGIYMAWNPQNMQVRNQIYCDYYRRVFISLWLLYNPRLKLTARKRYRRLKQIVDTFVEDIPPEDFGIGEAVLSYMRNKQYLKLYLRMLLHSVKRWNQ